MTFAADVVILFEIGYGTELIIQFTEPADITLPCANNRAYC